MTGFEIIALILGFYFAFLKTYQLWKEGKIFK